jgi:hypothetical protein
MDDAFSALWDSVIGIWEGDQLIGLPQQMLSLRKYVCHHLSQVNSGK